MRCKSRWLRSIWPLPSINIALLHAEQNNPLKAPISGVALVSQPAQSGQTPVERGSLVTRGQPLLNLIDPANLVVAFKVDEMLARRLQAGQEVQFYSDVLGQSLRGSVSFIAAQASPVLSAAKAPNLRCVLNWRMNRPANRPY